MAVTTIYLVRHAHAVWAPDEGRPLSAAGALDANRVAAVLCDRPLAAIYSSPSRRALDTVAPLAAQVRLTPEIVADLRERELPPVAAANFEDVVAETWRQPHDALPGGEPNAAAAARGLASLRDIRDRHPGRHIVISTHGTLMALIVNALEPSRGFEFWRALSFPDVYQLDFNGEHLVRLTRVWQSGA